MATTLDLVWHVGNYLLSAHTGDGRVFLLRQGGLQRLTTDHSYVQELIANGTMTEAEAEKSPYAHALVEAVGIQEACRVDLLAPEVQAGDLFLICTDGVYGGCPPAQIKSLMAGANGANLKPTMEALIRAARTGGSKDDATGILLEFGAAGGAPGVAVPATAPAGPLPQAKIQALDLSPCFGQLSFADKTRVLEIAQGRRLAPGEILAKEGELGDKLWVMVSGKVAISEKGVLLAEREGSITLGESALMESERRSATVKAIDTVHVLEFDRARLLAFFEPHMRSPAAQVYRAIATLEHKRMRDLSEKLAVALARKP
jgi:hypothetical protein